MDQALSKAKSHAKNNEIEEAQKLYRAVLQAFPTNMRALKGLAALNKPRQSANVQGPPQETLDQLLNLYNQGKLKAVVEHATVLTEQYPEAFILWNVLGAAAAQIGNLDRAIFAFEKVTSIKPDYADAYNNMGNALKDQGKLEEAIEAYDKALAIKPNYAEAYNNMGNVFKDQGKLDEAIASYEKAVLWKTDYLAAHNNMGVTLKDQGKLEEAIEAYYKAIAIKPDYAEAYNNMALTLKDQGNLEEAIEAYTKALAIKPDYAEAYNNMGLTLKDQGNLEEAIEAYTKALAIKPDYAEACNNMGVTLKDQGKLEESLGAYTKALAIKPDYAEAYNNMGVTLEDQGKLEEAIGAYNKAIGIKPQFGEIVENALSLLTQLMGTTLINENLYEHVTSYNPELPQRPIFQIKKAIQSLLSADLAGVSKHIARYKCCSPNLIANLRLKDRVFCSAYYIFIKKLIEFMPVIEPATCKHRALFHLGESHCLSYAHQKIKIQGMDYKIVPKITFGGKAFHFSRRKEDAFKAVTKANLESIPDSSKVFISFGEIDCRPTEGFIKASQKINEQTTELITNVVAGYFKWFAKHNETKNHNLYFFNVPAPVYDYELSRELNAKVATTIINFNAAMEKNSKENNFGLIDVYRFTVADNGFSNGNFHIDQRHLGPNIISQFEKQLN